MKIRRYLGYDCNSKDGFNNGHYIDDEPIEALDYAHAEKLCMQALSEYLGYSVDENNSEDMSHGDGPNIEVITGYFDSKTGEELTEKQFKSIDDDDGTKTHYRYVYVSAEKE